VELDEFLETQLQVVGGHGPVRMPRHLDCLPGLELGEDFLLQRDQLAAELADLGDGLRIGVLDRIQLCQPVFELVDRPFKGEPMVTCRHNRAPGSTSIAGLRS
jgi:hypothetical protein